MSQQSLKDIPFTEDPTQKELRSYATFFKSSYTSKFCDHFGGDERVFRVQDKDSKDEADQKANKVRVRKEDVEEGEGSIERKDLYMFRENFLRKEGSQNMRGYWEVEAGGTDTTTIPPSPVFQFGTLGLEVHSAKQGTIKLGTWDVEIILSACLDYEAGRKIMNKVSGSGISDEKIRFRWCLRGPTIGRDTHDEPLHKLVREKAFSALQGAKSWKGWGRS